MPATDLGATVHQGDVGTELVITVVEWDADEEEYVVVDISTATGFIVYLTKPRVGATATVTLTKTGALDTDGLDGKMKYVVQSGDLSVGGTWEIQGYVTGVGDWSGSTLKHTFVVRTSRHG